MNSSVEGLLIRLWEVKYMGCYSAKYLKLAGLTLLVIGVVYLLADYGVVGFGLPSWFTVVFLLMGTHKLIRAMAPGFCCVSDGKKK